MGFAAKAVSMRDIESASLRMRAKHVLMLFDSCFSGALFALVRAVPSDITEKSALPVRQYITAGREDEQVPDKSMFKRCFLIGLEGAADMTGDGYITGSEMGMYLADNVVNYTRKGQHPQYGKINNPGSRPGGFHFRTRQNASKNREKRRKWRREREALLGDMQKLKAEREETYRLLQEMKQLLELQQQMGNSRHQEKQALQNRITALGKERETIEQLADTRVKEYEAKLSNSNERIAEEARKRKALEAELSRVRAEQERLKKEALKKQALEAELDRLKRKRESVPPENRWFMTSVATQKITI